MLGWVLFFFEDTQTLFAFISKLFTPAATNGNTASVMLAYLPILLVSMLAATPLIKNVFAKHQNSVVVRYGRIAVFAVLFLLCVAALASQSYNPFIYFRF